MFPFVRGISCIVEFCLVAVRFGLPNHFFFSLSAKGSVIFFTDKIVFQESKFDLFLFNPKFHVICHPGRYLVVNLYFLFSKGNMNFNNYVNSCNILSNSENESLIALYLIRASQFICEIAFLGALTFSLQNILCFTVL